MKKKFSVKKPQFVVDENRVRTNIKKIGLKVELNQAIFRPHFKTHQSIQVGRWFRNLGIDKITVSSVSMATFFVSDGWKDITIAFPFNIVEIDELNELTRQAKINLVVVSETTFQFLGKNLHRPVDFFIKIYAGYRRASLPPDSDEIEKILSLEKQSNLLNFRGFMIHSGNNYHIGNKVEIANNQIGVTKIIRKLKSKHLADYPQLIVSVGDTPSISLLDNFEEIDEFRPGNFVYYDLMQYHIGSCSLNEIAVAVAAPIVHKHAETKELVVYAGAVHLSKESDKGFYGMLAHFSENGSWEPDENGLVIELSQEHAIITVSDSVFERYNIGDTIGILPVHSCLTADIFRGKEIIIGNNK